MSSRFEGWQEALSWKRVFGSFDERGTSLLGELSWSRVMPSNWLILSSDSSAGGSSQASDSSQTLVTTAIAVTSVGSALFVGAFIRSTLKTSSWRAKLRDAKTGDPAPGPVPLPVIGNILELRRGYYETLFKYVDKPAAVFWVMSTPFVVVSDETSVRTVLSGSRGKYMKPKYFGYRSRTVSKAVEAKQGAVAAESATYDANADASRVALRNMVEASLPTICESMSNLLSSMADPSELERPRQDDALTVVRKRLVSLNLDVLFGLSEEESDTSRAADMIAFAGTEFARRMVNPLKVLVDIPGNLRYMRDVGGLITFGRRLCRKLDEAVWGSPNASSSSLNEQPTDTGAGVGWVHAWVGKVGKIGKLGKVVGLLMASSQTVPITAVWMLHLVSKHKDVMDTLRQELSDLGVSSPADLTFAKLNALTYSEAVVRETLRLYPPFPLIQREAQSDDVLGGITVPVGSIVYIVPWLVHRNPHLWSSPHDFKPSRFSETNMAHGDAPSDWGFIPFGRGPRMCAGSQLALTELKALLTLALLGYDWSTSGEDDPSPYPQLGMIPRNMNIAVTRRQ